VSTKQIVEAIETPKAPIIQKTAGSPVLISFRIPPVRKESDPVI